MSCKYTGQTDCQCDVKDQRQADKKDAQLHEEAAIIERKAKQVAEEEENELDRAREIEKYGLRARMWQVS